MGVRPRAAAFGLLLLVAFVALGLLIDGDRDEVATMRSASAMAEHASTTVALRPQDGGEVGGAASAAPPAADADVASVRNVALRVMLDGRPFAGARLGFARVSPDAQVEAAMTVARADDEGRVVVELPDGEFEVLPDPGAPRPIEVDIYEGEPHPASSPDARVAVRVGPDPFFDRHPARMKVRDAPVAGALTIAYTSPSLLRGEVVRGPGSTPAAGVEVRVVWQDRAVGHADEVIATTRTGPDGSFAMLVPRSADGSCAVVEPELPGECIAVAKLILRERDGSETPAFDPVRLQLLRGFVLEGAVRGLDGRPVAGAEVSTSVSRPGTYDSHAVSTRTDIAGRFRIAGIPVGTGERGPRCSAISVEVQAEGHERQQLDALLPSPPLEVTLQREETFEGRVRAHGARAVVSFASSPGGFGMHEQATDAEGRFVLELAPERFFLRASAAGHRARIIEVRQPVDLVLDLEPARGTIEGTAARRDGRPAEGAWVEAWPVRSAGDWETWDPEPWTLTAPGWAPLAGRALGAALMYARATVDAAGRFRLDDLPEGVELRVVMGPSETRAVAGARGLRLAEPPQETRKESSVTARIEGEGATLIDAELVAWDGDDTDMGSHIRGSSTWTYSLSGRRLLVVASAPGFAPLPLEVDLDPDTPVDLGTLSLSRGGELAVRFRWPDAPLEIVWIEWTDASGARRTDCARPFVSEDDVWVLGGAAPGEVVLRPRVTTLDDVEHPRAEVRAVVRRGETTVVDIDLR